MFRRVGKLAAYGVIGLGVLSCVLSPMHPIVAAKAFLGWGREKVNENVDWPPGLPEEVLRQWIEQDKKKLAQDQSKLNDFRRERSNIQGEIQRLEQEKERVKQCIKDRTTTLKEFEPYLKEADTTPIVLIKGERFLAEQVRGEVEIHLANLEADKKQLTAIEEQLTAFRKILEENLRIERECILRLQKRALQIATMERELHLLVLIGRFRTTDLSSFEPREREVEERAKQIHDLYRQHVVGTTDDPDAGRLPIERELRKKDQIDRGKQTREKVRAAIAETEQSATATATAKNK